MEHMIVSRRRFSQHLLLAPATSLVACGGGGSEPATVSPLPVVSNPPFPIAGFNINMYGRNRLQGASTYQTSLDRLAATGSNTVLVTTPYFQSTATSADVAPDSRDTETDQNLVELLTALRARRLTVAYKFTVIPKDGTWSGAITPTDPAAWFTSYGSQLVRLASLAQANGVTLLYIANELQSMAAPRYASQWNALVDSVRRVYTGRLSWNAVLNARGFPNGEAFSIPVVSRLDHIGLSAYEPLTDKNSPTVAELRQAWYGNREGQNLVSMVKSLNQTTGKPIVFSELCYRSVDGNNRNPGDWMAKTNDVMDPQEQADCYEAFMRVWTGEALPWMHGVLWWQWMIEAVPDRFVSHDQTPQNNPAESSIAGWFSGATR